MRAGGWAVLAAAGVLLAACTARSDLPTIPQQEAESTYGPVVADVKRAIDAAVPGVRWEPVAERRASDGDRCVYQAGYAVGLWLGEPQQHDPDQLVGVVAASAAAHGFAQVKAEVVQGQSRVVATDRRQATLVVNERPGSIDVAVRVGC